MAPKVPGLVKGLGVTLGTMARTITQGANTVQYPREKEAPPIRARGVIIDVSRAAARQLRFITDGRVRVRVEVLKWGG